MWKWLKRGKKAEGRGAESPAGGSAGGNAAGSAAVHAVVSAAGAAADGRNGAAAPAPLAAPRLIIITGTSGSGRKAVAAKLSAALGLPYVPSYTTRAPRPHERDGEHYRFVDRAAFDALAAEGTFLESVRLERGSYGLSRPMLEAALAAHPAAVVVLNREGAAALRQHYGDAAVRVFLYVTKEDVRVRIEQEALPPEVAEEYVRNYPEQVVHKKESEFLLQNMDPTRTVEKIKDFLTERGLGQGE